MSCGSCADRRAALTEAFAAARKGDNAAAKARLAYVAASAVADAKTIAARGVAAARARLAR